MKWQFSTDEYGFVEANLGPEFPGFNATLKDSVGSRPPKGHPDGISTYWIDAALEGADKSEDGRVFLSGNATMLVKISAGIVARSEYEAFEDELLPLADFVEGLLAWRAVVVSQKAASD